MSTTAGEDSQATWNGKAAKSSIGWGAAAAVGIAALLIMATLAGPGGDFPLNDDWGYAPLVREMSVGRGYHPSAFPAMSLLFQIVAAVPLCRLTACTDGDLRLFGLGAGILLVAATAGLAHLAGVVRPALAALLVVVNPIFFCLSLSFLTDVPFAALATVAILAFAASFGIGRGGLVVVGTLTSLAATLTRDLGLAAPAGYLAVVAIAAWFGARRAGAGQAGAAFAAGRAGLPSAVPLIICASALALLRHWLSAHGVAGGSSEERAAAQAALFAAPRLLAMHIGSNATTMALYAGLFLLPATLATRPDPAPAGRRLVRLPDALGLVAASTAALSLAATGRMMPSSGNVLTPAGVGPVLMFGLEGQGLDALPRAFWVAVTVAALAGVFLLVRRLAALTGWVARRLVAEPRDGYVLALGCLLASLAAMLAPLLIVPFFDRYLVPVLGITACLVLADEGGRSGIAASPRRVRAAICVLAVLGLFAVVGEHDLMALNRARWRALADLAARGVPDEAIDGGFEFNGSRGYDPAYVRRPGVSWWWVVRDDYIVTLVPVAGRQVVARYTYARWMPSRTQEVLVLGPKVNGQ